MKFKLFCQVFCFIFFAGTALGQTLPVSISANIDDYYRRQQLLGIDTSKISYMLRPLFLPKAQQLQQSSSENELAIPTAYFRKPLYLSDANKFSLYALPIVLQNQFNSHHPYGTNDGAMIPAKGFQTQLSLGLYAEFGPLSVQLRPEFVYAANEHFTQTYEIDNGMAFSNAYKRYYNRIDLPEKLGNGNYSDLNWGQSSIRLSFDPVSIGISNENLWWGPGFRNALLMTNNAAGFKHITLNTTRPVLTPIGSFEAQVIGGKLEQSGIQPPNIAGYVPKPNDWRYLSGMVFTYQPIFLPGLHFGLDRAFIANSRNMGKGISDYLPFLSSLGKKSFQNGVINAEDEKQRDQYISFFARWLMPEAKSEIYVQWGRNDHSWDIRDAFVQPEHTRAYVAGFRKLIPFKSRADEFLQFAVELTQLEGSTTRSLRPSEYWYSHYQVTDGYTHKGQVLGAGIGPGSNMQTLDINWSKGFKRLGFVLERTVHNNDLYYDAFGGTIEPRRHWVDLDASMYADWTFGPLLVNAQLGLARSFNYQYNFKDAKDFWVWDKQDVNNFHLRAGLIYRW